MSPAPPASASVPRIGMLATVRNRRGIITSVQPFDGGAGGRLHMVRVEYTESNGPPDDQLLWEREPGATVLEPSALPDPSQSNPMPPADFDALVRATRWTALSPFIDPDGAGPLQRLPVSAPFHGAIQVEDFQLVPLLKALQMPRISLLLADDVGLGKTVEAGLILSELILRRRVRRVLVLCPASLRTQWRQELQDKFCLPFEEVDRQQTYQLRKRLGLDANPWRTHSRIVTSYHYLRQPDVLEEFRAACRLPPDASQLPWDMLIVDEAHNLMPSSFGEDSDLARMLVSIAPYFEHKLFLTATPHNGFTRCFTGLLEALDPVRFSRTSEMSPAERARVDSVLVRRLKREINERSEKPRFCSRTLEAVPLALGDEERALSSAFQQFRQRVRALVRAGKKGEQRAGAFAVEILGKRLLSGPVTFADSWHRYLVGAAQSEVADEAEVRAAERAANEETGDDRENEGRVAHAAHTVGAWLKPMTDRLVKETAAIDAALGALALADGDVPTLDRRPRHDARFEALCTWIDKNLRAKNAWRDDERLVVFTEFKTTLDVIEKRLRERYPDDTAIRVLYGGLEEHKRDAIKDAFNDPNESVRVLLATDAASEGLNLQETARFLWHYDVPWNPSRLEQRNGRLDRHGQARDVVVHHFTSNDDADLSFLATVVGKVHAIRDDLGSAGDVFEAAFERRFLDDHDVSEVTRDLKAALERRRGRTDVPRDARIHIEEKNGEDELSRLRALGEEIDLDPTTLRDTLEVALGLGLDRPRLEPAGDGARYRLRHPLPTAWAGIIDESLRYSKGTARGLLPALVFDPRFYLHERNGRVVFRPSRDPALVHLGHPLFHRALSTFARLRFPGSEFAATRWCVRHGNVPAGTDALVVLTVEELAVNELRETFHHWVRTLRIPVRGGRLGETLPHSPSSHDRGDDALPSGSDVQRAHAVWDDVGDDVKTFLRKWTATLETQLSSALESESREARQREGERFKSRAGELSKLIEQQSLDRLEREVQEIEAELRQQPLFAGDRRHAELGQQRQLLDEERKRRVSHYEELRKQLERERARVLERVLPQRYALRGGVQAFPVAIEIRLPGGAR